MTRVRSVPLALSALFGLAGGGLVFLNWAALLDHRTAFVAITVVLMGYLVAQILHLRNVHPDRWLLNPVVLCSLVTFLLGFGIGNLLFLLPAERVNMLIGIPETTAPMFKVMALVLLAAVALWQGYWSALATQFSTPSKQRQFSRLLRRSNKLHNWAIPALLVVSVLGKLTLIRMGLFGYSSSYDQLLDAGAYSQYLSLLSSLGKLALALAALEYYRSGGAGKTFFLIVLCEEVMFGFLSGFKSQVVMPFVTVGMCKYLATGRIPKAWMMAVPIGIFVAYLVIEPFRVVRNEHAGFRGTSVGEITSAMIDAATREVAGAATADSDAGDIPVLLAFLARSSYVYVGSVGVQFADTVDPLPTNSPKFLENIFLAPAHAWIPRFIWDSKPRGDLGIWYTQVVMGVPDSWSSTGMSPVTYLYFAGGGLAVFLGFYLVGFVQRVFYFWCQPAVYLGGAVVFLGVLQAISVLGDGLNDFIIVLLREVPLLLLVQHTLLRRRQPAPNAPLAASLPGNLHHSQRA